VRAERALCENVFSGSGILRHARKFTGDFYGLSCVLRAYSKTKNNHSTLCALRSDFAPLRELSFTPRRKVKM
jgi:hypothetical protein